jgi:hypothetical protein
MKLPHEKLPPTFKDAITIVRLLGVEYLWIDSLCIIQDSAEDWAYEAGRMADVYGHAYVTISADAAQDCQTGFLSRPGRSVPRSAAVPFKFDYIDGRNYHGKLHIREKGTLMRQLPIHGWGPEIIPEEQPLKGEFRGSQVPDYLAVQYDPPFTKLSTRGWVLQERLLSRRTLHFGPSEMGWECRVCIKCECTANSFRSHRGESLLKRSFEEGNWTKLVTEYTRMELTVKEDRLPAISGLAAVMARRRGDIYISGLWTSTLVDDLMWHTNPFDNRTSSQRRFSKYYAPTWSWASLTAPVQYRPFYRTSAVSGFEILKIEYNLETANPFGPVQNGAFLQVRGPVVEVRIEKTTSGLQIIVPWESKAVHLVQIRVILDTGDLVEHDDEQPFLFLMIRRNVHGLDGLVVKKAPITTTGGEVGFQRCGYAYARRGHKGRRRKAYTSDSSRGSEDDAPDVAAAPLWASISEVREIKIL